ncbi:hypothetical protein E8F11_06300 [Pseudomonas sp. BN417]|uniref:Rap1a/Tai family immunity protein n=1 Tax=Pseudomonas sp. BN417 TaxID=2567890 RepID=UPI00245689DC|nr:Rap1a/Tai family immunity protein [Pseudomonas sp. BN417]MDH4554790.1 hypothetical protein [Pseudomonas sp. BN417]
MKRILAAIGLVVCSAGVMAEVRMNGSELLTQCKSAIKVDDKIADQRDQTDGLFCIGKLQGIMQSTFINADYLPKERRFCPPKTGFSNIQAARVVVKYLEENPQSLHIHETALAIHALVLAYPCEK